MNEQAMVDQRNILPLSTGEYPTTALASNLTLETAVTAPVCVPLRKLYVLGVAVLPALVTLENLMFLFAMIVYRKKLKHNNVYRYVASCLLANVVSSLFGFYHFVNYYHGFEPEQPNSWWAFRKGMNLALSLILCGNIGLLIYAIEDNTYIVGRASVTSSHEASGRLSPQFRRRKANLLICGVWFLPIFFGMFAMSPWNCTDRCLCTLSMQNGATICPGLSCSNIYTPMAKSYLLVVVLLWAAECCGLLFLFCKSLHSLRMADKVNKPTDQAANTDVNRRRKTSIGKTLSRYRDSHSLLIILFLFFFVCTAPIMTCFVLDFVHPGMQFSPAVVNILTPLPFLYCLVSPLLVSQRLSGIKSALLMALTFSWVYRGKRSTATSVRTHLRRRTATEEEGVVMDGSG